MDEKEDVFEKMWIELKNGLALGQAHSFNQHITYMDVLNVMNIIENSYETEILARQKEDGSGEKEG